MRRTVSVRVPGSTANLGPGFDSFGLALGIYNTFTAELADTWSVEVRGEGVGELSSGAGNQVARAMARVFAHAGQAQLAARVVCDNGVPTGRGLGSSSAAIVGGLMLANELLEAGLGTRELFRLADDLEGHADNVGAALYGGFVICWRDGQSHCATLQPAGGLAAVVAVGTVGLSTKKARGMLPTQVPHTDAAFNVGHAGLMVAGLLLGQKDLLAAGMRDRLHEQYRSAAVGDFERTHDSLIESGADAAALSGAGPTVVGIVLGDDDAAAMKRAAEVVESVQPSLTGRRIASALALDRSGAVLL